MVYITKYIYYEKYRFSNINNVRIFNKQRYILNNNYIIHEEKKYILNLGEHVYVCKNMCNNLSRKILSFYIKILYFVFIVYNISDFKIYQGSYD